MHADVTGEIEQSHNTLWSTVWRVPTTEGTLWFKASAEEHSFEPALTAFLSGLMPTATPALVAADDAHGWMLTRDHGDRLREMIRSADDLPLWKEVMPRYAELQIAAVPHVDELLALGVRDERLAGIPSHFARLLDEPEFLLIGERDGLSTAEHDELRERLPEVEDLCRRLRVYRVAETIQHDDLSDGDVFLHDGRYVFVDWGDACISHPFHTLVVTLRSIAHRFDVEPGAPILEQLRDAYLEPFGRPEELRDAFTLAYRIGTLARALAWYEYVAARPPELRAPDVEAVPYGLQRFLENGPIGSWRWD